MTDEIALEPDPGRIQVTNLSPLPVAANKELPTAKAHKKTTPLFRRILSRLFGAKDTDQAISVVLHPAQRHELKELTIRTSKHRYQHGACSFSLTHTPGSLRKPV